MAGLTALPELEIPFSGSHPVLFLLLCAVAHFVTPLKEGSHKASMHDSQRI